MPELVVWVSEPSVVCASVKRLLDARGFAYRTIQVSTDEERERMVEETGRLKCPQVYVDRVYVGGLRETNEAIRSGRLSPLLTAA